MKILTEIETYWNGFQWFEVLDGLLGPYWKALGLAFNCTFLLFGSVIQLIACARLVLFFSSWFLP
jgi:auxin influx carrier (AUX1 LAX family)